MCVSRNLNMVIKGKTFHIYLVAGQLSALARLSALRHLNLQLVRIRQVNTADTKASGRHLLYLGPGARLTLPLVEEPLNILAALARIRLAPHPVHGLGQRGVRLNRNAAKAHGAGGESLDDLARRLHLVNADGLRRVVVDRELAAQRAVLGRLRVALGELLVGIAAVLVGCFL